MVRPRVGIVIPALNEETSIAAVIQQCLSEGIPIVVDDGSTDNTAKVSEAAGAEVIQHTSNKGYDAALISGFKKADAIQCDYVITIDADGQHDPELIKKFIAALTDGADVVVGIRDIQQRLAEVVFSFFTKMKVGIYDPLCGLKGYRLSVYRALGHFDSYNSIGTELTLFASSADYKIAQIPVSTRARNGAPRFAGLLRANYKIFRSLVIGYLKFLN